MDHHDSAGSGATSRVARTGRGGPLLLHGARMGTSDRPVEIWDQSVHRSPLAAQIARTSRETCRPTIGHVRRHWSFRKDASGVIEVSVDNVLKPGNLEGGFADDRAAQAGRLSVMKGEAPVPPPIATPTALRGAEHDPLFPDAWTDRLGKPFTDLDLAPYEGVSDFPHPGDPDRAAAIIDAFLARLDWTRGRGAGA